MSEVLLVPCEACGTSFAPEVMIQRGDLTVCAYCELRVCLRRLREAGIGAGELRLYLRSIWQEVWQIDMDDSAFHRNRAGKQP